MGSRDLREQHLAGDLDMEADVEPMPLPEMSLEAAEDFYLAAIAAFRALPGSPAWRPSTLTIGSLFSGVAGLELGVEAALAELGRPSRVVWQAEKDPYARAVLAKHWPEVRRGAGDTPDKHGMRRREQLLALRVYVVNDAGRARAQAQQETSHG